jgi:hypothetical protein
MSNGQGTILEAISKKKAGPSKTCLPSNFPFEID